MSIQIQHLSFAYGEKKIFDDLSLDFPSKGFLCILGASGSGKTTLISLLNAQLQPTKGKIRYSFDTKDISMVFQSSLLLDYLTLKENVFLPLLLEGKSRKECEKEVIPVLKKLQIEECQDRYPRELSGGEQMRGSIARGLMKGCQCMILDEPTGQLDEKNSEIIYGLLKTLSEKILVILVSHDEINATKMADRIYRIEKGKVNLLKKEEQPFKEKEEQKKKEKQRILSLRNALFLNRRYLHGRKARSLFSILFLSFNFILIYLGFNLSFHMDDSLDSLLKEYYSYETFSLSMEEEVANSGSLHLKRNTLPDDEVFTLLGLKQSYYSLDYFIPSVNEVKMNGNTESISFYPTILENPLRLKEGHRMNSFSEVIVNESFIKEFSLKEKDVIDKTFTFHHEFLLYSRQFQSNDHISLSIPFTIVGISKEKTSFNRSSVYYSYFALLDHFRDIPLKNISRELNRERSLYDMISDSRYDDDDFKSTSLLSLSSKPEAIREKASSLFEDKVNVASPILETKSSTKDIISSLLKILSVFVFLNTLSSLSLEFLSVYSLYEENIRLFALIRIYQKEKKSILVLSFSLMLYFLFFTMVLTMFPGIILAGIINSVLKGMDYPAFFFPIDTRSFLLVGMISFLCCLVSSLLPLRKIKESQISKELEGED